MNSLTIDVDWAPTPVLRDTLSLLNDHDIPTTVFSTHDDNLCLSGHERALHPNFATDDSKEEVLEHLTSLYPDAVGVRSHRLHTTTSVKLNYPDRICYESNYMMFGVENLHPFWHLNEIVQLPIYFMDDVWLRHGKPPMDFTEELDSDSLTVFTFHPVHIYINTPSIEYYEQHKDIYDDPEALRAARSQEYGVRDLFVDLLGNLAEGPWNVHRMSEIRSDFAATSQQPGDQP